MKLEVQTTIEHVVSHFSGELYYYTVDGVRNTAHVPVGTQDKPDNWTSYLLEYIEKREECSLVLCDLRDRLKLQDKKLIELERTFSAIHCYRLTQEANYEAFIEAQVDIKDRLTPENFLSLCETTRALLPDVDSCITVESLIIFSDLGKSPAIRKLAEIEGIDATLDNDDLMLAILQLPEEKIEKIMPRYKTLSEPAKQMLRDVYPFMTICFGHLCFLEGNSKVLENIQHVLQEMQERLLSINAEYPKRLLNLAFAAQFFDAAGANGQEFMYGSRTFTNCLYRGYQLMLETIQQLHERPATGVFQTYLTQRAAWLELDFSQFDREEDFDVVLRLSCTLRLFDLPEDKESAQKLKIVFYQLSAKHQRLLSQELSFDPKKGLQLFAHAPHYVATGAQNICRRAPGEPLNIDDARNVWNYTIVFARLIEKLRIEYTAFVENPSNP